MQNHCRIISIPFRRAGFFKYPDDDPVTVHPVDFRIERINDVGDSVAEIRLSTADIYVGVSDSEQFRDDVQAAQHISTNLPDWYQIAKQSILREIPDARFSRETID